MEQVYKNIHKDELGKYFYITNTDTIPIIDIQTQCSIFIIELLMNINKNEKGEKFDVSNMPN